MLSVFRENLIKFRNLINLIKKILVVTVDVMGVSGDNQDAIEDDVLKQQLDADGNVIAGSSPEKQSKRKGFYFAYLCFLFLQKSIRRNRKRRTRPLSITVSTRHTCVAAVMELSMG